MFIKVSGHSDDIVCVEGDLTEEFYPTEDEPFYVAISEGTLLRVSYDGMWNIRVLHTGLGTTVHHEPATDEDENYSDVVTLTSELPAMWAVAGVGVAL